MRAVPERTVLTILRDGGAWAVELEGALFGKSADKEVTLAYANKRAREIMDGGGAAQVLVRGEARLR